jgi:hypothetical protein
MFRSKEIVVLVVLFVIMAAGTIWYVIDRRAKNRVERPAATRPLTPDVPAASTPLPLTGPVVLGTKETERKTVDFSSGQPVVKDSPADKAALEAGLRDIDDAAKDVTFEAAKPAEAGKKP